MTTRAAPVAHIRNVHVADSTVGHFLDPLVVPFDPGQVAETALGGDGIEGDLVSAGKGRCRVDRQLHWSIGLVPKQLIGVRAPSELLAIDSQNVVAHLDVDADLGQGRTVLVFLVVSGKDLRDAVAAGPGIELEFSPGQRNLVSLRQIVVSSLDIGMTDAELGDHFADQVVEIGAMPHVL